MAGLIFFGTNDIKVSLSACALLRDGDVFLDIGANYATVGLAAAAIVGPTGTVHLFEPQRSLAERVETAIRCGSYQNVTLHRLGLMDKDGKQPIMGLTHHSGSASFCSQEAPADFRVIEECAIREIGSFVRPLVAERRFGAKLDVEGAEPAVMPWLLNQPNLSFLIFEGTRNRETLYQQVKCSGLALYGLDHHQFLRVVLRRVDTLADMSLFRDLVAIQTSGRSAMPANCSLRHSRRLLK